MWICDTHSDTLYAMGVQHAKELMITPQRLRQGGVTLQTFALWTGSKGNQGDVNGIVAAEMAAIPALLAAGMRQVDDPAQAQEGESSFMLSIEGGEVFESGLETVAQWREKGVRMAALLWNNENALGHSAKSGSTQGLTSYGLQVVREMQRLHMAVDTSHLNEAGFYDIFAKTHVAPMASHSCCRALCDHFRNLTDEQLRLMIRQGGYVGINFYPAFLNQDGKPWPSISTMYANWAVRSTWASVPTLTALSAVPGDWSMLGRSPICFPPCANVGTARIPFQTLPEAT